MDRTVGRRAWSAAFCLVCMTVLWLAMPPEPVQAHPCDDLYSRQQDRETCWWHYWNSLAGQPQPVWTVGQYTTKPHRLHPGDPRIAPRYRVVKPVLVYQVYPVRQYTTKPHRLHPNDPRIAPWDRRYPPPVRTVYVLVDERVCDSYYAHPDDRANCRWRVQNGMPVAPAG